MKGLWIYVMVQETMGERESNVERPQGAGFDIPYGMPLPQSNHVDGNAIGCKKLNRCVSISALHVFRQESKAQTY